jgi:hypothetical protein
MFKYIGDQADRLSGGLVGATLGVVFSMSAKSIGGATAFLVTFFTLFCLQRLPRYLARERNNNGMRRAFLIYVIFFGLWLGATIYFCNLNVFQEGWSAEVIDLRVLLALFTLLIASVVSIVSATIEGIE